MSQGEFRISILLKADLCTLWLAESHCNFFALLVCIVVCESLIF